MFLPPRSMLAHRQLPRGDGQLGVIAKCESGVPSGLENSEAADANCCRDRYQRKNPFNIHPFPECPY